MDIVREEVPRYITVILRKSTKVKLLESFGFIILVILISLFIDNTSGMFKILIISSGALILLSTPLVYKPIVKPKYILTKTKLIIEKSGKKEEFSLLNVEQSNDLRFMYNIDGKKVPLMITENFIEELNQQIEYVNRIKK